MESELHVRLCNLKKQEESKGTPNACAGSFRAWKIDPIKLETPFEPGVEITILHGVF